jgi:hypothetical protein
MIDWKCPNHNCLGRLENLTFYEPRVLHQYISENGRIATFDSSACEGEEEGFLECDLCGCRHHPDDRVHCPDNTITSLLDLWYERAAELRKERKEERAEKRRQEQLVHDMEAVREELQQ